MAGKRKEYILENAPPPFPRGGVSVDGIWGTNMKKGKKYEKVGNMTEK